MFVQSFSVRRAAFIAAAAMFFPVAAQAQVAWSESFESGLNGWTASGFSSRPIAVTTSNLASTDGSNSMAVTQDGGGFSWNTKLEQGNDPGAPLYQAWQAIANVPENLVHMRFDVIYRGADFPDTANFANMSVWMNNDNGFRQYDGPPGVGLALLGGAEIASNGDFVVPVDVTINQFSGFGDRIPANANFYQIGWSFNSDFGAGNGTVDGGPGNLQPGEATVYYDNFRLEVVPEPTGLSLAGVAALGLLRRRRNG